MGNLRDLQAKQTRQRIIDCVYELLRTTDYQKIRITDIARSANVSVGTVYLYFHSKGDIVTTFVRERNEILTSAQTLDDGRSVVAQYHDYIDSYLQMIQRDGFEFSRGICLAMIEEHIGHDVTAIALQDQFICQLIERGLESGELKSRDVSPHQFFEIFINAVNGSLLEWFYTQDEQILILGMMNAKELIKIML